MGGVCVAVGPSITVLKRDAEGYAAVLLLLLAVSHAGILGNVVFEVVERTFAF